MKRSRSDVDGAGLVGDCKFATQVRRPGYVCEDVKALSHDMRHEFDDIGREGAIQDV